KGTSEPYSVVTFEYDGQEYTTNTDSNGKFQITFDYIPNGTNSLNYWAKDLAGNVSDIKKLVLVIGCENFPIQYQEIYCGVTPIEVDDNDEGTGVEIPEEDQDRIIDNLPETGAESAVRIRVVDEDDNPVSGATVTIDGMEYTTDQDGYIELVIEEGQYSLEIIYNGETYYYDLLIDQQEELVKILNADDSTVDFNYMYCLCCLLLLIIPLIFFFLWKRDKDDDDDEDEKNTNNTSPKLNISLL
ncbi:hypothetical protein KC909_03660, partial [Candidatus Dojkabacteria bacterium]|nr:hypothetical protein [Candidatus Dojkabacteria bacterium]